MFVQHTTHIYIISIRGGKNIKTTSQFLLSSRNPWILLSLFLSLPDKLWTALKPRLLQSFLLCLVRRWLCWLCWLCRWGWRRLRCQLRRRGRCLVPTKEPHIVPTLMAFCVGNFKQTWQQHMDYWHLGSYDYRTCICIYQRGTYVNWIVVIIESLLRPMNMEPSRWIWSVPGFIRNQRNYLINNITWPYGETMPLRFYNFCKRDWFKIVELLYPLVN